MRHLRAYLVLSTPGGDCEVSTFRDLESIEEAWAARKSAWNAAALHVGFWRPDTAEFASALAALPGRMLLSESAVSAMPEGFQSSKLPVASAGKLRLFLGLEGWGYECDDPSPAAPPVPTPSAEPRRASPFGDWFAELVASRPDVAAEASAAGVNGEESYLSAEFSLSPGLREALGMARFLHYAGGTLPDAEGAIDFMAAAPPWLLSLPIATLGLSTRSKNCMGAENISKLEDFTRFSASQVLKFQNLGRKSFHEIGEKILSILTHGPSAAVVAVYLDRAERIRKNKGDTPVLENETEAVSAEPGPESNSFRNAIEISLSLLTEQEHRMIGLRMGLDGPKRTLDSIANGVSLTRERVRQIESRCVSKMSSLPVWGAEFGGRISSLLDGREDPLPLEGLDVLDPWFSGAGDRPPVFEFAAERLSKPKLHLVEEGPNIFVSLLRQQEWEDAKRSARRLLSGLTGRDVPRSEARRLVEGLLTDAGAELRSELWFASSRLARFAGPEDAAPLISFGHGAEHHVEAALAAAERPLHYSEIQARLFAGGENIEIRRVHQAAANVGLLYGRGLFGTERHFPLKDAERRLVVSEAEDVIAGNGQDRQWHAREICDALDERGLDFGGRLDPYLVSIALRDSKHLSYLGRMVWAPTASGAKGVSDRLDVHQAIVATLMAAGGPLTSVEIKTQLSKERGLNVYFQVQPEGPLVRVGTSLWGLENRDLPFSLSDANSIVAELGRVLAARNKGLHVTEVVEAVAAAVPSARNAKDPVVLFGLAQKRPGFSIGKGQYLYLTEWESPRRITVYDATLSVLRSAGRKGLSADEGIPMIEALVERLLAKNLYGSSCNNIGALFDEGTGRWYLDEGADNSTEDTESELAP